MSWYTNPMLFIFGYDSGFYMRTITKEFGITILASDLQVNASLNFYEHLSLGDNTESDYDAFKATFPRSGNLFKLINCQGSVITWNYPQQRGTWSREPPNSLFWSLPGITKQKSDAELLADALAKENSELKAKISTLEDEVNNSKEAVDDLQQQVKDLTSKLVQCCGVVGGGSEPWISGQTVPSTWVPFGELDVLSFSKNTPFTITKATGGLEFGDDNTTNVRANRFYGGIFPIVVVDVAELTPNREDARFDPCVWGLYNNAGISYAARKPFASEMSFDARN